MGTLTDRACPALSAALGRDVRALVSRPWASTTFNGEKAFFAYEGPPLTLDLSAVEVAIEGAVLADLAELNPGRLEALLVELD